MSNYAKSIVGAVAAVLITGVDAWQSVTAGAPFRLLDVLPIATAVVGAVLTLVVPNVPELPTAKAVVSGVLAVLTALSTFVTGHPADITLLNLVVAGLGAVATWYIPNLPQQAGSAAVLAAKAATGQHVDPVEITDALRQLGDLPPVPPAPPTAEIPVSPAWSPTPLSVLAAEPTPIGDAAGALAAAQTAPQPAVTPATEVPA